MLEEKKRIKKALKNYRNIKNTQQLDTPETEIVKHLIQSSSDRERVVLFDKYVRGLSKVEIAEKYYLNERTVYKFIDRAINKYIKNNVITQRSKR